MSKSVKAMGFILILVQNLAGADGLTLDAEVYEWGEPVKYQLAVFGSYGYFLEVRHRFTWEQRRTAYPAPASEPFSARKDGEIDSETLSTGADPSRNYYDIVLLSMNALGTVEVTDSETILVVRKLPKLPEGLVSWSFQDGATLAPGATVRVQAHRLPGNETHNNPTIQFTKPGRVLAGGAVEPDQLIYEQFTEMGRVLETHWVPLAPYGNRISTFSQPLLPPNALTVLQDGGGFFEGAWRTRTAGDPLAVVSDRVQHDGNKTVLSGHGPLSPIPIGPHLVRILGAGHTVLDERHMNLLPPRQEGAIQFEPVGEEPFESVPTILIRQRSPALDATEITVAVDLIGRRDIHIAADGGSGAYSLLPNSDGSMRVDLRGPLRSGRYRVSLYLKQQNILLDQREFDYEQPKDDRTLWPAPIEPPVDPDDVTVTIESGDATVLGEEVRIRVHDEDGDPLKTIPLVAELFFTGHYTYGCFWRQGYYTGSAGLVTADGKAAFPAPGEPGRYEVRVFRPMNEVPIAGYSGPGNIRVARPYPGSVTSPQNMELIGSASLNVTAPAADGMIDVPLVVLTEPFVVTVRDPGTAFKDHSLSISVWRSHGRSAGGQPVRPFVRQAIEVTGNGEGSQPPGGFPFAAGFDGIDEPGDYEVRVQDLTTGLYIARQEFSLRNGPPELPAFARYEKNPAVDDLPLRDDPQRGTGAWQRPASDCVDPEFDEPPVLEIVELWPNDLRSVDDDEYREPEIVWPGHPYLIQARFETAPPDDTYRLKIDGERRVTIYRTSDDPRLFRSRLVTFTENQQ